MKSIEYTIKSFLERIALLDFAEYFCDNSFSTEDSITRIHAIEIASLWYESFLNGSDGKQQSEDFKNEVVTRLKIKESRYKSTYDFFQQYAAMCNYTQIMEHKFHCALYGVYRHILQEDVSIDPFDAEIDEYIRKHISKNKEGRLQFCIKLDGLNSTIVKLPDQFYSWTEYGDMLIFEY
ncbi:hypothetical protein [Portibacter lacus]|uniref:Uncharacterized protein n=1 Tax=Portibacter lacus TaxID=1099794 RepID=A0AA37WGC2_9BACT|nr:hypothetical protein [Portibacter lacus]GLR19753.1 hypothetical protein GCM10007940_43690 [Portibacter lacus]